MRRTDCGNIAAAMSGKDREFAVASMCISGALHSLYDLHALYDPHALYHTHALYHLRALYHLHALYDPHGLQDPHNLHHLRALLALACDLNSIVN